MYNIIIIINMHTSLFVCVAHTAYDQLMCKEYFVLLNFLLLLPVININYFEWLPV